MAIRLFYILGLSIDLTIAPSSALNHPATPVTTGHYIGSTPLPHAVWQQRKLSRLLERLKRNYCQLPHFLLFLHFVKKTPRLAQVDLINLRNP